MIAAHRARHRAAWIALALLLPLLLALALRARPDRPRNPELPAGVEAFADDRAPRGAP